MRRDDVSLVITGDEGRLQCWPEHDRGLSARLSDAFFGDDDRWCRTPVSDFGCSRTANSARGDPQSISSQTMKESRAIKRLRPNLIAEFELRVGNLRVMYAVDSTNQEVIIGVVGEKRGNQLFVEGREYHDHESDESE